MSKKRMNQKSQSEYNGGSMLFVEGGKDEGVGKGEGGKDDNFGMVGKEGKVGEDKVEEDKDEGGKVGEEKEYDDRKWLNIVQRVRDTILFGCIHFRQHRMREMIFW
jgi:hypothetical protein